MTHKPRCSKCNRATTRKSGTAYGDELFCSRCWNAMPTWMHRQAARAEATR